MRASLAKKQLRNMQKRRFRKNPGESRTETEMVSLQADEMLAGDKTETRQRMNAPEFYTHASTDEQICPSFPGVRLHNAVSARQSILIISESFRRSEKSTLWLSCVFLSEKSTNGHEECTQKLSALVPQQILRYSVLINSKIKGECFCECGCAFKGKSFSFELQLTVCS